MLQHLKHTLIITLLCSLLTSVRTGVDWRFKVKQEVTHSRLNGQWTEIYTYDEQGRLIYDSLDNAGSTRMSYNGDTVRYEEVGSDVTGFYVLNSRGYAIKNDEGVMWQYDAAGFSTTVTNTVTGDSGRDVIMNGDVVISYGCSHGQCDSTWHYYYLQPDLTVNPEPYKGRNSTHLAHYRISQRDNALDTMTYEYEFDKLGRVTTKIYHHHGNESARKDFSYVE